MGGGAQSAASSSSPFRDNTSSPSRSDAGSAGGRPVPHVVRKSSNSNLSTSAAQRHPARSFVTQSSFISADPAQYSSHGVREQTAELASWALGDSKARRPRSPSSRPLLAHERHSIADARPARSSEPQPALLRWGSADSSLPEVIEEVSEPVTPEERASGANTPRAFQSSALSDMFKDDHASGVHFRQAYHEESDAEPGAKDSISVAPEQTHGPHETTPLLRKASSLVRPDAKDPEVRSDVEGQVVSHRRASRWRRRVSIWRLQGDNFVKVALNPKAWSPRAIWERVVLEPAKLVPCVFLGLLLNVLDALSYGMILFPLGEQIFADTGPDGISMFYVSCIVAQLVYSCGGSIFKGAVGSEMIEVVPFFHKMTYTIMARTGKSQPNVVLATVITAYAMSSILTGIVFFILGAFKLGTLVSFFPRHILIGCIGGVGFFLFVTGIEVSARLEGNLEYNLDTAKKLFQADTVALWVTPLVLAILLMVVQRFNRSPFVVPAFFIVIAAIFYIVAVAVPQLSLDSLRGSGWIFEQVEAGKPWYNFYTYYDFNAVDWGALASTIPAMFALTFFGILHVPINVPALGIAAEEDDLDLNRELIAHGVSNALSGCVGSIQNYLVYVNSEMFIHNGGNSRLAGLLLAAATFAVLVAGPAMIGYVPIMVVGALIFYLGIALLEEALYDTWGKMNRLEYLTVLAIVLIMGIYDFVVGIVAGIILACLNFVVQTSRKSAIRATYSGENVGSTVRRHPIQRHFLHEVGHQIYVTKLAGFLFFGSIVEVEKASRALIEEEAFRKQPIRYLVFDLHHVHGVDYSAAEAFTRMERVLGRRDVRVIVSGIDKDDDVGRALRNVGLWLDGGTVEFFETLNTALEYCENELLQAFYRQRDVLDGTQSPQVGSLEVPKAENATAGDGSSSPLQPLPANSPRQMYLQKAATSTLDSERVQGPKRWRSLKQPLPLILQAFQDLTRENEDFWFKATPYFERVEHPAGTVLYQAGDHPRAFFLLQTGILHAHYALPVGTYHESIVAGTTCGELPFFSATPRTATVWAERDCVAWRLGDAQWRAMQEAWPDGAREVLAVALKLTKERVDAVTSYVLTTAG